MRRTFPCLLRLGGNAKRKEQSGKNARRREHSAKHKTKEFVSHLFFFAIPPLPLETVSQCHPD